ncbi:MAG TPA: Holliday junction resolvase RuvX [Candidatus Onthocola stercoravium]|nr:Holliday junction resolvase RuvX [Candidatus Onthocola stercoravium]
MSYLGLDLGTTTLGVAISDKTNTLVSPLTLIKFEKENYEEALESLLKIMSEKSIKAVVLGLPKNMDNSLGFAAERSFKFKEMLESKGIKVYLEDERLTTVEALNIMKNNGVKRINKQGKTDMLSAVLILESFLKRNI